MNSENTKGLTGLANLGNTCFMNSAIQCLSNTPQLHHIMKNVSIRNPDNAVLFKEWNELLQIIWNQNCIVAPRKFLHGVHIVAKKENKDIFTGYAQNDLPEFILFFIDSIHNAIKRKVQMNILGTQICDTDALAVDCYKMIRDMFQKEYSEILSLFYGIHVSQFFDVEKNNDSFSKKNRVHYKPEPFFTIHLPIPPKRIISLIDCFDAYTCDEYLTGDNQWLNSKTKKKQDVCKNIVFFSFPDILVIDLKRFDNHLRKSNVLVDFPLEDLDLSKYVIGYNKDSYHYDLYGICNHSGSVMGGHYTAYVRNKDSNQWYHYNDSSVTIVKEPAKMKTSKAYCLFYKKRS